MKASRRGWTRATGGVAATVLVAGLVAVVLLATSAGGSSGGAYQVRAIFDDAVNIVPGEDVKIDGVKVGTVGTVTPTPQERAAVVLNISKPGFENFRTDASCTIKPQSLLGEKFVECEPTQPRAEGTPMPASLKVIPKGHEGEGEYLLPVSNTSSPVNVDLLEDITRLPERQQLTIIINELGAGLAGKGSDIAAVVRRADPALRETDKVLNILGNENKILASLAVESDKALKPLAAVRGRVADFIVKSNRVAKSTAAKKVALAKDLADFPAFLRQLGPAMTRLGKFAEQTTPVFTDLGIAAPQLNRTFTKLGGFSESSNKFFHTLGSAAKTSGPALVASKPLLGRLQTLGNAAQPVAKNLSTLLSSVRNTGGLEDVLNFIFLGAGATNGYDSLGHFLRAQIVGNTCITYQVAPFTGCSANFISSASEGSSSSSSSSSGTATKADVATDKANTSVIMDRTMAVLKGSTPAQAIAEYPGPTNSGSSAPGNVDESSGSGAGGAGSSTDTAAPAGGSGTTYYEPASEQPQADERLLNYLLGD